MTTQINTNQVKNLNEVIQDMIASFLVEGPGIDFVYDDVANTLTVSSSGGGSSTLDVTQTAHGLVSLDRIYFDESDGLYKKARANSDTTLGMWHVVEVVDVNNIKITKEGTHTVGNALALGEYLLSPTTAGGYTQTIPTSNGQYVLYGMEVLSSTKVSFYTVNAVQTSVHNSLLNHPEGTLINGKIERTVTSNNLTFSLKTMDGSSPSVGNPVYCRIGDVVRTITAPLSNTLNAGTNRYNAGSNELATYEIDYFVYLGRTTVYNTVYIQPARISYATKREDFSSITTNEKYAPNAGDMNLTDLVVLVGRFNATLSVVGTYNWSVPVTSIIINRPVYESRWLSFLGIYKGGGGGDAGTYGERDCKYKVTPKSCECYVRLRADKNTLSGTIQVKLPFQENNAYNVAFVSCGNFSSSIKNHHGEIFNQNLQVQNLLSDNYYNWSDFGSNVVLKGCFNYETT